MDLQTNTNPILKIAFVDGGENFQDAIHDVLDDSFNIRSVTTPEDNPDLVVFSCFGNTHKKFNKYKKLWMCGENNYPNFDETDYAVSCHRLTYAGRHLRIPFYYFRKQFAWLLSRHDTHDIYKESLRNRRTELLSRKFCSSVISNNGCEDPRRVQIVQAVNKYKKVDSAGKSFNNVGRLEDLPLERWDMSKFCHNQDKHFFIRNYKFNLALENSNVEGYVTEKIVEAFAANTVPIYFGTNDVKAEFNHEAFINANDYPDMDSLIKKIKAVDENDDLYMYMLCAPKFTKPYTIDSQYREDADVFSFDRRFKSFIKYVVWDGTKLERRYGWVGAK